MERIEPPWQAIKEWIPDDNLNLNWFNQERDHAGAEPDCDDQSPTWQPVEIPLDDGRILVLDDS
jgi:hypothetical protein